SSSAIVSIQAVHPACQICRHPLRPLRQAAGCPPSCGGGMRLFGRGEKKSGTGRTVAEAAIAGASREELIQAAMQQLRDQLRADRLGVWLAVAYGPGEVVGIVWTQAQVRATASAS